MQQGSALGSTTDFFLIDSQSEFIGKYQVLGVLGRGSMGLVYRARDPEIGREVAIKTLRKLLPSQLSNLDVALERFRNEARSAGNLRHPNIITIFEVGRDKDTPYIVMDYVEGEPLDVVLEREKRLSVDKALRYLYQIASGLDYAHSRGVIHKDVKPGNILVDKQDNVFILDFGIATINESLPEGDPSGSTAAVGTPGYMSPEQIMGDRLDPRSDIFSLGILSFQLLAGKRPFPGATYTEVISNILNNDPLALSEFVMGLPIALDVEIGKAISKDKDRRPRSATAFVEAMARAAGFKDGQLGSRSSAVSRNISRNMPIGSAALKPTVIGSELDETMAIVRGADARGTKRELLKPAFPTASPGEMFAGDSGALIAKDLRTRVGSPLRMVTVGLGVLAVVLGTVLIVVVFSGGPSGEKPASRGTVSQVQPVEPGVGELTQPLVDAVPVGVSVDKLSDRQLLGVLVNGETEGVLIQALQEGLKRRLPEFPDAAAKALSNDSYVVRIEAMKTLAEFGDKRIVPELMVLLDDHDPLVRSRTAQALGRLGDRRSLGFLSSKLVTEEVPEVRSAIKSAIEKINGFPLKD